LGPIDRSAVSVPIDEDLFVGSAVLAKSDMNNGDSTADNTVAAQSKPKEDREVPPLLSYEAGGTSGSVIGQWAARFRKATSKT
jgi:hypothetical protein